MCSRTLPPKGGTDLLTKNKTIYVSGELSYKKKSPYYWLKPHAVRKRTVNDNKSEEMIV